MPLYPSWDDIAIRLLLTVIAGAVIGFNRGVRGHAAGLRTTILVGLAAAAAMIQANVLLTVAGKTSASFGVLDLMRLPLGILTGVGFIGGGTILKRGDLVTGVTTAATLWVVTVIGLCLGGGQIALGIVVTVISAVTLLCLGWVDRQVPRKQRALIAIAAASVGDVPRRINDLIAPLGYRALFHKLEGGDAVDRAALWFEITWKRSEAAGPPLDLVGAISESFPVRHFELTSEARH